MTPSDLPAVPLRMSTLPRDSQGVPVPWFAVTRFGKIDPEYHSHGKIEKAVRHHCCWLCGERLGRYVCFLVSPRAAIARTSAEPPSHLNCATYCAQAAPFMLSHGSDVLGVWTRMGVDLTLTGNGRYAFDLGKPTSIEWWTDGRLATKAEVIEGINAGIGPLVAAVEQSDEKAQADLVAAVKQVHDMLPQT